MGTFSKVKLSNSSNGKGIGLVATAFPISTTIHQTGISNTIIDEIWLYAHNTDTVDRKVTIEYGGSSTTDLIEYTVKAESGLFLLVPGLVLTGTGAAVSTVTGFAAAAGVVNIFGYVNRITP